MDRCGNQGFHFGGRGCGYRKKRGGRRNGESSGALGRREELHAARVRRGQAILRWASDARRPPLTSYVFHTPRIHREIAECTKDQELQAANQRCSCVASGEGLSSIL